MTLRYFLVNIHINNQPTLYKVNGVVVIAAFYCIKLLQLTLLHVVVSPSLFFDFC
jgi:hypothetical protein